MSNKRIKELKNLSAQELVSKSLEIQKDLFQAKMKKATGQLEKQGTIWKLKKDLARVKTLQTQAKVK
jgi:large subunit ribosomal protein L29